MLKSSSVHLVIGLGEVGKAIREVLGADGLDINITPTHSTYDVLHICFPYSNKFVENVVAYQKKYTPSLTIIHSTVPIGTSRECNAVHSPVRGIHPHLTEGVRTFVKYFGGKDAEQAAKIFRDLGITVKATPLSENTEALKLWDTTIYGMNIIIEKAIHEFCKTHDLDFNLIYADANTTYNEGYERLGHPEYKKYILAHKEGPIGGHCVIPNAKLIDSPLARLLQRYNKRYTAKENGHSVSHVAIESMGKNTVLDKAGD